MADTNPTFKAILQPDDREEYEYKDYVDTDAGDSKVSDCFKKLGIAKVVVWKEPELLINHGKKLARQVKDKKFKYEDGRLLDPALVRPIPKVPANLSHIPEVEQDAVLIDSRHGTDAVDEIWRLTDPLDPHWVSRWRAEFPLRAAGTWKEGDVKKIFESFDAALGLAALESLTARPREVITISDLYQHLLAVARANKMITNKGGKALKMPYVEGRIDRLGVRCKPNERLKLDLGIPNARVRPNNGKESKKPGLVSKHAEEIANYAKGKRDPTRRKRRLSMREDTADGITPRRAKWFSHDGSSNGGNSTGSLDNPEHSTGLSSGALSLFTQCQGYQVIFRIKSIEIYDTRAHIFIRSPDLPIHGDTTTPQLWREAMIHRGIGGASLEVSVFTGDLLQEVPAARLAMQDLGRAEVPLDVVPTELLSMTLNPAIKKPHVREGDTVDTEAVFLGRWEEISTEAAQQ